MVTAACVLLAEKGWPQLSGCTVDNMLSGLPQKGKGESEEGCLLVWMRKEIEVGGKMLCYDKSLDVQLFTEQAG